MPPQSQSHSSAKPRYVYIDLLRGWAVFVMIETHVTNAFILPAIRLEPWFNVVNFTNGIVAPSFLFVAGYAFAIVGQRKWNDYLAFNWVFWKQIGRILQIWIIGYALHLPFFSFHKLAYLIGWEEWTSFWPVDVLQCIAVSLLLMLLLVVVTRNRRTFFLVLCAISALVVFATPYTATLNIDDIFSLPFSNYLNALHGSLFPLFPWMGFLLSGGVVGQLLVFWKEKRPEREYFRYIGIGGVAMILVSIAARFIPITIYPPHEFWVSSPEFVFIRLGIVLMILAGLWFWEQRYSSGRSLVSLLGSESLVTYTLHLLVIYGLFFGEKNLASIIGTTRTVPQVIGISVLLIIVMGAVAYIWNSLKKKSMFQARVLQYSILCVLLAVFLTKPY